MSVADYDRAPMKVETPFYRNLLEKKFASKVAHNPRYSLRAFAKSLNVQPGTLSQILSGKRQVSVKIARRFFTALSLSPSEQMQFLHSIAETKKQLGHVRMNPELKKILSKPMRPDPFDVKIEMFSVISEWYHTAITQMTYLPDFKPDAKWIAEELEITPTEAHLALTRLLDLDILEEKDGKIVMTHRWIDLLDKQSTSAAQKRRQKQILEKSYTALENIPISERNHSGITLPIEMSKIPEAKKMIQEFMWDLTQFLSSGKRESVYELTVNLFPLQRRKP